MGTGPAAWKMKRWQRQQMWLKRVDASLELGDRLQAGQGGSDCVAGVGVRVSWIPTVGRVREGGARLGMNVEGVRCEVSISRSQSLAFCGAFLSGGGSDEKRLCCVVVFTMLAWASGRGVHIFLYPTCIPSWVFFPAGPHLASWRPRDVFSIAKGGSLLPSGLRLKCPFLELRLYSGWRDAPGTLRVRGRRTRSAGGAVGMYTAKANDIFFW